MQPDGSENRTKLKWLASYAKDFLVTETRATLRALFSPMKALLKSDWNEVTKAHNQMRQEVREMDERHSIQHLKP